MLDPDAESVFDRLKIAFGTFPEASYSLPAHSCPNGEAAYTFESTHEWMETSGTHEKHTCGVVKLSGLFSVDLPMSVTGGSASQNGIVSSFRGLNADETNKCNLVPFFKEDKLDYARAGSIGRAILSILDLPKWIDMSHVDVPTSTISASDLIVSVVRGDEIDFQGCDGLPAVSNTLYTLVRYNRAISVTLGGTSIEIPAETVSGTCLLLDICSDGGCSGSGGVAFLLAFPEPFLEALKELPFLKSLAASGLSIASTRIGLGGKLDAFPSGAAHFWNGAQEFEHCFKTENNFYIGGAVRYNLGGSASIHIDGEFFFYLPGLCGDFPNLLAGDAWSMGARGNVRIDIDLWSWTIPVQLASVDVLLSLGGSSTDRKACTTWGYGDCASPSGIFFTGRLTSPNPFYGTLLESLLPTFEAEVNFYFLMNQQELATPAYVKQHFQDKVSGVQTQLNGFKSDLEAAINVGNDLGKQIQLVRNGIKAVMTCADARKKIVQADGWMESIKAAAAAYNCWGVRDDFVPGARALVKAVKLLDNLINRIDQLATDAPEIVASAVNLIDTAIFEIGGAVGRVATQVSAEFLDLPDGFGVRGKVGLKFGPLKGRFGYLGVEVEITYSRGATLMQCNEFNFVYDDIFEPFFRGTTTVIAKSEVYACSGGDSTVQYSIDNDDATIWEMGGADGLSLFPNRVPGLALRTWSVDEVTAVHMRCDGPDLCPANVSLWKWNKVKNNWVEKPLESKFDRVPGQWQARSLEVPASAENWDSWKIQIESMWALDESGTFTEVLAPSTRKCDCPRGLDSSGIKCKYGDTPSCCSSSSCSSGSDPDFWVYPQLNELRLIGRAEKYALAGRARLQVDGPLGPFPLSLITLKSGVSNRFVIGLASPEPATFGLVESLSDASHDGNYLFEIGADADVMGISAGVVAIVTTDYSTSGGPMGDFRGGTLTFAVVGDIWGLFRVRLAVTVYLVIDRLGLQVQGIFENSFLDKAAIAVHDIINAVKNEANERFDAAQAAIESWQNQLGDAQNAVGDAQNWLDEQKKVFDDCKDTLDDAIDWLEEKKAPLKDAQQDLRDKKADVDNVCSYKTCSWKPKHWDNCAYNTLCAIARGVVYAALTVAEVFLEALMVPIDLAQGALDVAKLAFDAAKVAVDLANVALEGLKYALDVVIVGLEAANIALEVVQQAVSIGLEITNRLLTFVIGELFNIRKASFEVEVTTRNPFRFRVSFDLTILGVTFNDIGFEFDFVNAISSFGDMVTFLWDLVKGALGARRRRDLINEVALARETMDWKNVVESLAGAVGQRARSIRTSDIFNRSNTAGGPSKKPSANRRSNAFSICHCHLLAVEYLNEAVESLADIVMHESALEDEVSSAMEANQTLTAQMNEFNVDKLGITQEALDALGISSLSVSSLTQRIDTSTVKESSVTKKLQDVIGKHAETKLRVASQQLPWHLAWRGGLANHTFTSECLPEPCGSISDCISAVLDWAANHIHTLIQRETVCDGSAPKQGCSSSRIDFTPAATAVTNLRSTMLRALNGSGTSASAYNAIRVLTI